MDVLLSLINHRRSLKVLQIIGHLLLFSIFMDCSDKGNGLSKHEAFNLLCDELHLPDTLSYDIYLSDPQSAKELQQFGLEEQGYVSVQKHQRLKDAGKPIIQFTEKSKAYLLSTADKRDNTQAVITALKVVESVNTIQLAKNGTSAAVEFVVAYKNITPFAKLYQTDYSRKETKTAHFSFFDDAWHLQDY